ncbi:MAG: hypothetical protein IT288_14775 [Bdellovibrionales bacterium]|nr:hypothetical protein [Bdellovibrionales bacterium]
MKKFLMAAAVVAFAGLAAASAMRDLEQDEIDSVNWILQCPKELGQITKKAQFVSTGRFFSDRMGTQISYNFFRRKGFIGSEYVSTLKVARMRRPDPVPADAPSFTVVCQLVKEQQ